MDVHDKHVFSKRLYLGSYFNSQALYVFLENQGAPIQ
jgi:hypothetical protein